jgi:prevent-host-death family protein
VKQIPLSEIKEDLSRFLREAESEELVITSNGKPAGLLIGFGSADDWFDFRLESDPRFVHRIRAGTQELARGSWHQDRRCGARASGTAN